jgi:hypothetical protein
VNAEQASFDSYRRDLATNARDYGAELSLWSSQDWARRAGSVLDEFIAAGGVFTSQDVTDIAGQPPSPGATGALFLKAAQSGRTVSVGLETSRRQSRHGGLVRRWRAP